MSTRRILIINLVIVALMPTQLSTARALPLELIAAGLEYASTNA